LSGLVQEDGVNTEQSLRKKCKVVVTKTVNLIETLDKKAYEAAKFSNVLA